MTKICLLFIALAICAVNSFAQEAGNVAYGGSKRPKASGVVLGNLYSVEPKDSVVAAYLEANTMINANADEYVAVFGLSQEGPTLADCNAKMDQQIKEFTGGLEGLGIRGSDTFVDFIAQNKVYDFGTSGSTARERLSGFELKKNISIRYKDRTILEKIQIIAAKASIFDLIKVDYIVSDLAGVRAKLFEEAMKVIKRKEAEYAKLLDTKLRPVAVYQEKYGKFSPSEMYSSYQAYETGSVDSSSRDMRVVEKRKSRTFYFDPLDPGEFDTVVNPVIVEPMVQFTLFLKVRYLVEPAVR
jgi:uncharacterized protein YggE